MLLYAGPAYCGMYSTDVYCSKQTGSSSTKETITIISSFLELGEENCVLTKFVAARRDIVKTETSKHS